MAPGGCPKGLQQPAFSMLAAPHPTQNIGSRKCFFFKKHYYFKNLFISLFGCTRSSLLFSGFL